MKKILVLVAAMAVLAGCNTVKGFGQDLSKVGDKIEQKAAK
ncbi:MAG: entericidin A/B family lipoprotein [Pseudomonadota bacterium]|jgi:entericidin A